MSFAQEARELEAIGLRAEAELARDAKLELFRAGDLECMILPHRLETYRKFREWNVERQTRAYRDWCASIGARFDKMWVDLAARRTAKTGSWIVVAEEECIRFFNKHGRGAHGMIAIPVQKKIGGVLVPLIKKIFRDAPPEYIPQYRASGQGEHEHLYVPACDGRIKLVGLDHHPDALRGPFLDFGFVTEGGYTEADLESVIVSEIMLQLQNLPHAFFVMESSAPKTVDHSFNRVFVLDAQARGAFSTQVITDNTSLSPEEIEDEIRMTGGRESAVCKRELFNIVEPDPELMIIPEFDEKVHVVDPAEYPMPTHALAHEGYDPGTTDPHGLVGAWFDWMRQTIVICFAWAKSNASTGEVVSVAKEFERLFWGAEHEAVETRKPGAKLLRLANARKTPTGKVWEPPAGSLSYWDESSWTLRPNPFSRVSDIDNQFVIDMNVDYAMQIRDAEKGPGSHDADEQHLRMLFAARHRDGSPKIVILRNGHTDDLIMQCRSGMWKVDDNHHKTDWARTKILGHCDTIAAAMYMVRDIRWRRNPFPPALRDLDAPNVHIPPRIAEKMRNKGVLISLPRMMGSRTPWRPR
jgi:hypothetical protein